MLQPKFVKKLNENAAQMQSEGASIEEIMAMKDAFMAKFGTDSTQKKNQVGNGSSTTKETPSVSSSKIQPVTSLGGEKTPTVKASATSTGVKITPFKGFSKEEMTQMKKPESVIKQEEKQPLKSVKKAPLYAKQLKLQRELSTAVVTPENQDEIQQKTDELAKIKSESIKSGKKEPDFVDSLVANLDAGLFSVAKAAVKDAPEMAWDLTTTIGATAADILGDETLAVMTKYKADDVAKILGFRNLPAEQLEQSINRANSVVQEYNDKNGGDALTALSNGNYLGASKMIAGSTMQSLPLMIGAMMTGGGTAALGTISAASAAMKYGELKEQTPELSTESKLASAVASGILEGFVGKFFSGASGAVAKKIILDKGVEEGSKIITKGFKSMAMNAIEKSPIVGLVGEITEEGSVEFGNQTIEIANGTRDSYDFKKIGNAGISATGMGITNTVAVYGAKGYIKLSDYNKVKKTNKEIFRLTNELSNPNLTDFDKSVLSQRVDRLVTENKKIVGDGLEKIKALPNEVKSEIVEINNSLDVLKNKVLDLEDNFVLSAETKSSMIQEIKSNVKELTDRKLKIIEGTYIYDDFNKLSDAEKIDRKDKAGIELLNEAKAKGAEKASFDDAQITKKAVEDYGNERKQRSDRETANQEKPTGDQAVSEYTQPTGEGEKGVRSVQEEVKNIVDNNIKTGLGVSESYSDIESVPEFMKPLAKPGAKGETTVNGVTKQTQRYSVIATAEELQDAYDNFYGKPTEVKGTPDIKRKEKYNAQYNALVSGQVLDNAGDSVYEEDKGIGANGLSTLTDKKYGHGHIRTSGLDSLNILESLLDGSDFSGMFGKIGTGEYSTWESGKFIIVSNNINPTKNNKLNLKEIEIILNAGLSPFAQELANKYPNVIFKDFNGKKYDAELASLEGKQEVSQDGAEAKKADIERRRQEELKSEKSFEGNRNQAKLLRLPDNYLKKGEYVLINNVNISQDSTMPDYRTGKYKVQMISVNIDGKDGIVTLSDGNEVITPKISDLINAKYDAELASLEGKKDAENKPAEAKGTPDVISQPIDLTVPSKTVEAEVKPTEPTVAETPIVETPKESKARQTLVDKTKNAEAELKNVLAKTAKVRKPTVKKQPTLTEQLGITKKPAAPKSKTGKVSKDEVVPNVVVPVPDEMSIIEESKPTKSVDIVKTSDNGLLHASNFEGIPYEIEGGIGLVQGFSPFGNVVYAPYKGEYRIRTDVSSIDESSKQTMLNKDELARLKELRNNLESQESKNESESKNPFEQQGRVASSDSVPTNVRDFVKEITDSLGITSNIFIITDGDFNESQYKKHGLFGKLASIRSAVLSSKDSSEWGHKRAISSANANYIYYGGNLTESQVFSVVAHEVGHIVESELFKNASPETKAKVRADYDAWFAKLNGKTVVEVNKEARDITLHDLISNNTSEFNSGSHGYISSFSEYLADNVGKWVRSSEKPKTLVDKFFSNLAEEFKKIYDYVFKTGNYSKSMFEWLDEQYLSNKKQGGAVSTDASLSKMKGAGESYDPKGNSENQSSINKAILKYAVNKIALGTYDVNAFVKDMASNGIELTKEGADFLFDKSQKAYKAQIEKLTGVSRKPSVGQARQQKVINKAYSVGVATQKIETEAQKQKAKEVKAEISDLKKQFNDVISAIKTEKDISKKEALQKQANKLNEKISDLREKSKLKVADLKEKARLEISDLKAQFNDIMSAIKTERDIVRKEALQKQADKLNDKIAGIKKRYEGKLTEAKSEIKELKDKVKDIFSASIEAVKQVKNRVDKNTKVRFEIGGAIKSLANRGKITQKQSADISKKLSELNVENEQDIRDFLDYVDDVFLKSDKYQKIADADKLSARLKSMSKGKTKSNKLTAIAKRLSSIDTSKVKDIDKHIEVLNDALSGLKGTTIETKAGEKKIVGRAPMSVEDISNYMDEHDKYEFEESKKEYKKVFRYEADEDFDTSFIKQKISEMRSARSLYKKLTGEDAGGMTLDKISEKILEVSENESVEENFEKNYQEVAEAMLSESKRSAQEVLDDGVNPLTGEPLIQKEIDIVNSVINFSAKELTTKEMVNLINKLDNFTKNGVLGGLGDVASKINGNKMAAKFKATGKTAKVFKRYFSPTLGNAIGRYLTNPRFIIDEIFLGRESGEKFWKASGIRGFQNGKAKAIKKASVVLAAFEKFNDNKSFMDVENVYERAMWAHISREVGNNLVEKEKNFAKVKDWMKQSYENLMNSKDSKDVKKGEYYKKVYDKILDGSNSIDDVRAKVSDVNLESVDVYKKAFSEEYSTTKFTMDAYFNKDFRQDDGYAMPVRFGNVDIAKSTDVTDTYFGSNKKVTLRKKAGSMNEDKRSNDLGKKYIDLDFDRIAHQEFEKVCIANETIPFAVQYQTFKNTKDFGDIIEDDGTRDLIKTSLDNYIITSQGVNVDKFEREWQKLSKFLGAGSKLAVSQSLVGISQLAKQTVPMMPSTLINSGKFDFTLIGNKDFANFLANSGRSTAMRGLGSLISFDAAAEALKANKKGAIDSFFQYVSKKKDKAIEFTVKKPDVFIADISWGTYYQQKVGPVSDWSKHDIDTDAADYADSMVDADQGASDPDLVGEVFRKSGVSGGLLKMALPFARFAINTKANLHKNLVIAFSRQTSNQERVEAFRGISATMTQLIAFKALSQFIVFGITEAAKASFGEDDEDELNDGISQMMKDKETSQMYLELIGRPLIDAFSPVPATDELVAKLINYASGLINEDVPEGMRAELFESKNNTTWGSNLGLISISIDNILKAHKAAMTAKTGVIKGKGVQTVTAQDYASPLLGVLILSALTGIGLTELTSYARKSINMEAGSKGEIKRAVAKGTKFRNYVEEEEAKAKEEKKESVGKIKAFLRQYGL